MVMRESTTKAANTGISQLLKGPYVYLKHPTCPRRGTSKRSTALAKCSGGAKGGAWLWWENKGGCGVCVALFLRWEQREKEAKGNREKRPSLENSAA